MSNLDAAEAGSGHYKFVEPAQPWSWRLMLKSMKEESVVRVVVVAKPGSFSEVAAVESGSVNYRWETPRSVSHRKRMDLTGFTMPCGYGVRYN